jgi:hypothetical protein
VRPLVAIDVALTAGLAGGSVLGEPPDAHLVPDQACILTAGPAGLYDAPIASVVCPRAPASLQDCRPLRPGEDILHPGHLLSVRPVDPVSPLLRYPPPHGYTDI